MPDKFNPDEALNDVTDGISRIFSLIGFDDSLPKLNAVGAAELRIVAWALAHDITALDAHLREDGNLPHAWQP